MDESFDAEMPDPIRRRDRQENPADREHLKLLAVFHFVLAGVMAFFSCFALIYVAIGLAMLGGAMEGQNGPNGPNGPPPELGAIFAIAGGIGVVIGWTLAGLIVLAGRRLIQHRSRVFCMVIAAIMCLSIPFGTILGVFTLVVLSRPSVRELFGDA